MPPDERNYFNKKKREKNKTILGKVERFNNYYNYSSNNLHNLLVELVNFDW
jgi:hypothetical protein